MATMEKIKKQKEKMNLRYELTLDVCDDVEKNSNSMFEIMHNMFVYGYLQGVKATKAEIKKRGC